MSFLDPGTSPAGGNERILNQVQDDRVKFRMVGIKFGVTGGKLKMGIYARDDRELITSRLAEADASLCSPHPSRASGLGPFSVGLIGLPPPLPVGEGRGEGGSRAGSILRQIFCRVKESLT